MDTPAQIDLFTGVASEHVVELEFPELPDCFFEGYDAGDDDKREAEYVDARAWQDVQADETGVPRFGPI